MITAEEAEILANNTVVLYLKSCKCETAQDKANVLMKLTSMCGLAMLAAVGKDEAAARPQGTTNHIANQ